MLNVEDFIADYLYELEENTAVIEKGIILLKKDPQNPEELKKVTRALHTIKGASRMLNFGNMEKITHGMESIYKGIREKRYVINKLFIQLTFIATDYLHAGIEQIKATKKDELPIQKLLDFFAKVFADAPILPADLESIRLSRQTHDELNAAAENHTVRIKANIIDNLIKSMNNLIIREFQLKKEKDTITDLEEAITQFTAVVVRAGQQNPVFKKHKEVCLKLVQSLKNDFQDKIELIAADTFKIQEEIFSLRMLPLQLILSSLGKMVEETALSLGKEVELQTFGEEIMLDKLILEKINDPLIHLIRNAIDHGIEVPETREKNGKPHAGKIEILCYAECGNIMISIKDDGRGLDYDLIRSKALAFKPEQESEIRKMSNEALHTFLFMSGFSTKKNITALSGRGVGLDIVGHNIEKIKGKITVKSEANKGTEFVLSLPLSLATVEGFFVRAAGEIFLVPANFTKEILLIGQAEISEQLNKKTIQVRDRTIPVYRLAALTGKGKENKAVKYFVLVVESLGELTGIIVEEIIQYAALIYKPLPVNLAGLKSIQGIVFDESLNIINILYIPEIINKCKCMAAVRSAKQAFNDQGINKDILVVDDAFTTREIEREILEMEQYRVTTAVDGMDALEKLKTQSFHLILTDINMPRMDGMQLLEKVRQGSSYSHIPVIVISPEPDTNIEQRFLDAGADAFIVKSQFDRNNLLSAVQSLIG